MRRLLGRFELSNNAWAAAAWAVVGAPGAPEEGIAIPGIDPIMICNCSIAAVLSALLILLINKAFCKSVSDDNN